MNANIRRISSSQIAEQYSKYGIILILALVFAVASVIAPRFFTIDNLFSVFNQIAVIAVIACGMTLIIISGNADLSAGSGVALVSCVVAVVVRDFNSGLLAIVMALLCSALMGTVSGYLVSYKQLHPFIVTLALQMAYRGLAYLVAGGAPVLGVGSLNVLATGKLFGVVPNLLVFTVVVTVIVWFVLSRTVYGRYLYAIGGNRDTAQASGINVKRSVFFVYIIMGVITGFAGILYSARTNSGLPAGATAYEFDAIIACVLGGSSMAGGVGNVFATICGALVVGIINNCMNLLGINAFYQQIVKGLVIIIAIMIDRKTRDLIAKS